MKELSKHLTEAFNITPLSEVLKIGSKSKVNQKYKPKDNKELKELVKKLLKERGNEADLNDIDTSEIKDMSWIFYATDFNGNISEWDVSNVEDMHRMFLNCFEFTGENTDISNWDVHKVKDMSSMFSNSVFKGDIHNWDAHNVTNMRAMFTNCPLEKNPPKWYHE